MESRCWSLCPVNEFYGRLGGAGSLRGSGGSGSESLAMNVTPEISASKVCRSGIRARSLPIRLSYRL